MRSDSSEETGSIWFDMVIIKHFIQYPVEFRVMYMMHVWKQVMCNMVVEAPENKICSRTERVKII